MTYNLKALEAHNKYRKLHQAGPLVLEDEIRMEAQKMAEKLSSNGDKINEVLSSDGFLDTGGCGYSVATLKDQRKLHETDFATNSWYSNVKFYNHYHPGHNEISKSFVRMVWKDTKVVGFGISGRYIVARYCKIGEAKLFPDYSKNVLEFNTCKEN